EHHTALVTAYTHYKEVLREVCADKDGSAEEDGKLGDADADLTSRIFAEILEATEAMDIDGIETALEKASHYRFQKKDDELLTNIRRSAENFDYEAIVSMLQEI
ncbi:MAG: hypothetical protein IK096_03085, partial [Lachnospiraceae bacterium]|nr:hypothetical protein [Lachnospiraceae bacterium]